MKNELHTHNCHICKQDFKCNNIECGIEDEYAVCYNQECINKFEGKYYR